MYASDGDEIAGSTRYLADGYWAWVADEPPDPGTYRATISAGLEAIVLLEAEATIELSEPWERQWPELTSDASVSVVSSQTEGCCALNDDRDLEFVSCAPTPEDIHLALSPAGPAHAGSRSLRQFMFRYRCRERTPRGWCRGASSSSADLEDAIEPCYELEVLDRSAGPAVRRARPRCAEAGRCRSLGARPIAFPTTHSISLLARNHRPAKSRDVDGARSTKRTAPQRASRPTAISIHTRARTPSIPVRIRASRLMIQALRKPHRAAARSRRAWAAAGSSCSRARSHCSRCSGGGRELPNRSSFCTRRPRIPCPRTRGLLRTSGGSRCGRPRSWSTGPRPQLSILGAFRHGSGTPSGCTQAGRRRTGKCCSSPGGRCHRYRSRTQRR